MAQNLVTITLTQGGGIMIEPWVRSISRSAGDSIKWQGNACRIKIGPDHPEHFSPGLPQEYDKNVHGQFDPNVPLGTHHYRISVLQDGQGAVAVYSIDPDYKVDR